MNHLLLLKEIQPQLYETQNSLTNSADISEEEQEEGTVSSWTCLIVAVKHV